MVVTGFLIFLFDVGSWGNKFEVGRVTDKFFLNYLINYNLLI